MRIVSRSSRTRTRELSRRLVVLTTAGALAAVLAVVLGIWRPWLPPVEPPAVAAGTSALSPGALRLPEHPRVLVFGDSWTYGAAATAPSQGYAYLLADLIGGQTMVDGVRGSGYQKPGIDGPDFRTRIIGLDAGMRPDLVIIQGSINDRREDAAGYPAAVDAAWDALAEKFPATPIVVLGPAPHELPVGAATARIDHDLARLAAQRGWWYVSPVQERWITEENYLEVIDVEVGRRHPSDAGHRYLAQKVAEALLRLSQAPVTTADEAAPAAGHP